MRAVGWVPCFVVREGVQQHVCGWPGGWQACSCRCRALSKRASSVSSAASAKKTKAEEVPVPVDAEDVRGEKDAAVFHDCRWVNSRARLICGSRMPAMRNGLSRSGRSGKTLSRPLTWCATPLPPSPTVPSLRAAHAMLTCVDFSIDAPPSTRPQNKYCDVTGLPAKYADPQTAIRYYSSAVFQHVKTLSTNAVQAFLRLRNAGVTLK